MVLRKRGSRGQGQTALPARPDDKPSARQLTLLAAAPAGIDPVFQAIERARALVFIDGSFADRWRALAEQASAVRPREAGPSASKARRGR